MSARLPSLKPREVLQALKSSEGGFVIRRITGSHHILQHRDRPELLVTVPFHNRDMNRGTLRSILRQADLTPEEFLKLL